MSCATRCKDACPKAADAGTPSAGAPKAAEYSGNIPAPLQEMFKYIDAHKAEYIEILREAVAIQSVSASPEKRGEVRRMMEWCEERLQKFGARTDMRELGKQTLPDGSTIDLPPALFAAIPAQPDPKKRTVLIYGHLDVQPASKDDGWDSEPFVLTERDGRLYGRGSSDDKGPVLCWLHVVKALQDLGQPLPVNLRFVFEGMEESGSEGLDPLLMSEKDKFMSGVDFVCISDNYWLGTTKPCITYGLRGLSYFSVEVECAGKDLHSGVFGGNVHEAMADLVYLLNTLVDKDGKILIPGIYDEVAKLTPEEQAMYKTIEFDVKEYRESLGAPRLMHKEHKEKLLMHRWRYPSLSMHGIQGAFSEVGAKTVIPRKVNI